MSAYSDRVVNDGASNYWRLNETSGLTAVDLVGGKTGTISGGVTLNQAGALADGDKAMLFNGTTGKIVTAANVAIPMAMTIEAWIKVAANSYFAILSNRQSPAVAGNFYFGTQSSNGALVALVYGGSLVGVRPVSDGQWHHVIFGTDGVSTSWIYVDGVLDKTGAVTLAATSLPVAIGYDVQTAGSYWQGPLDDLAIYPRALGAGEIAQHFTLGKIGKLQPTTYPERVIVDGASNHWRLGETSGTTAVDVIGGKNGTLSGGVTLNQPGAIADGNPAMTFDGTTGKIVTAANVTIPVICTVEAWVKVTGSVGDNVLVSARTTGATGQPVYFGFSSAGSGTLFVFCTGTAAGVRRVIPGAWHHVVYVLNGSTVTFYQDGTVDGVPVAQVRTTPSVGLFGLGWDQQGGQFYPGAAQPGVMDEIAIYPLALTPAQIAAHFTQGITAPVTPIEPRDYNTTLMSYLQGVTP